MAASDRPSEITEREWDQLFEELFTTNFNYGNVTFYPQTDTDRALQARFAHLSPTEVAKLAGKKPASSPFKCPKCQQRPASLRENGMRTWLCKCIGLIISPGVEFKEPHSSQDWLQLLEMQKTSRALVESSQQQDRPQSN